MLGSPVPQGLVFSIMRFAVHDGPGVRTTVFLKGCPLSCQWCHNPESQSARAEIMYSEDRCVRCGDCVKACPHQAIEWRDDRPVHHPEICQACGRCAEACPSGARQLVGRFMSVPELLRAVSRDVPFYEESGGGVTFSGGEPLLQAEFLEAALEACKADSISTAVDTCGHAPSETLRRISRKTDLFLYDLKVIDPARHRELAGVDNQLILRNLAMLAGEGCAVVVRIPVVPGVNDTREEVDQALRFLGDLGLREVALLPYHQIGMEKYERLRAPDRARRFEPPTPAQMEELAQRYRKEGFAVQIGG